jgi:hypothetical protein
LGSEYFEGGDGAENDVDREDERDWQVDKDCFRRSVTMNPTSFKAYHWFESSWGDVDRVHDSGDDCE